MEEKIKQKCFIQIPILIVIILLISISVVATIGIIKYKGEIKSALNNISSILFKSGQETNKGLTEATSTPETKATSTEELIEELKKEIEALKEKPPVIIQKETINSHDQLTSEEVAKISQKIVYVKCYFDNYTQTGSGVLSSGVSGKYMVATNAHIIFDSVPIHTDPPPINCTVSLPYVGLSEKTGFESTYATSLAWFGFEPERNIDTAFLYIEQVINGSSDLEKRVQDNITSGCLFKETGMNVYIFGYPSYAVVNNIARLTITDGIISGNTGREKDDLGRDILEAYFTTAIIDSGNSGGLAITKLVKDQTNIYGTVKKGTICKIGKPTWVTLGNYANIGLIQNE